MPVLECIRRQTVPRTVPGLVAGNCSIVERGILFFMAGESVGGKAALQIRLAMFSIAIGAKACAGPPPRLPTDRQLGANLGANLSLLKIGAEAPIEWSKERGEGNEAEGAETYAFYLPITVTADRSDPVHAGAPSCLRLCAALSQVSFVMKPPLFSYVYVVPSS